MISSLIRQCEYEKRAAVPEACIGNPCSVLDRKWGATNHHSTTPSTRRAWQSFAGKISDRMGMSQTVHTDTHTAPGPTSLGIVLQQQRNGKYLSTGIAVTRVVSQRTKIPKTHCLPSKDRKFIAARFVFVHQSHVRVCVCVGSRQLQTVLLENHEPPGVDSDSTVLPFLI